MDNYLEQYAHLSRLVCIIEINQLHFIFTEERSIVQSHWHHTTT